MKKLLSSLALAGLAGSAFAAGNVDGLTVKAKVDFESEYIFRGKEHSDSNLQTKVQAEYALPAADAALYAGVFMMSPVAQVSNEVISFLGAKTMYEGYLFEAGYTHYSYANRNSDAAYNPGTNGGDYIAANNRGHYSDTNEVSFGVGTEIKEIATVSGYIHYNFDLQQTTYEAAARRAFKGEDIGAAGFELIVAGFYGYVQANQENGDQREGTTAAYKNDYGYIGASADIAYAVSNTAKVGTGVRYAYNNDGNEDSLGRNSANTDENFWYGIWAEFKY